MSTEEPVSGLLVVDKPSGCTSHDVVDRIRKVYGMKKVGHAGTLDPMATGVLLVGLGKGTRLLTFLQGMPKEYRAEAKFGISTDSQDADGRVIKERPIDVSLPEIEEAASAFRGEIVQLPPMVSAVKIGGEALYKKARRGEEIDRPQRAVRIYALNVEAFDPQTQTATLYVKCSSGTYVRTLASDLGDALKCGAHLVGLRRLAIGSFKEPDSVPLEELERMDRSDAVARVLPLSAAMRDFPQRTLTDQEVDDVSHGRELAPADPPRRLGELPVMSMKKPGDRPAHEVGMTTGIPIAVLTPDGQLIAVYRKTPNGMKAAAVLV